MNNLFQASAASVRFFHILARIGVVVGAFFVSLDIASAVISFVSYHVLLTIGISVMMHRYFSHRSFEFSNKLTRIIFVAISLLSMRGSPLAWAYIHRPHHEYVDTEKDPHTPVGRKFNFFGLPDHKNESDNVNIFRIRSLMTKEHLAINKYYWLILVAMLLPLAILNFKIFYYAWLLPVVLIQFSINLQNYLGHTYGFLSYRTYNNKSAGDSQNSWILWPLYLGEAWHNNHHALPRHFHYGKEISGKWWEIDPGGDLIKLIKK